MILIQEIAKQAFNQSTLSQPSKKQVSRNPTFLVTTEGSRYSGLQAVTKISQSKAKNI
ncbi:MAG: hypothetical protein WA865_20685 [Spirulinaceae cyanobacterium]